jgi:cell division protein FtsQ
MNKISSLPEKGRKRRGHSRFVIFFALILVALGILFWLGYGCLSKAVWLSIRNISITGNENVATTSIQTQLQEFMGENLVKVSSRKIKQQLLKIKRIKKAKIVRLYPRTLKVRITERVGFLYLKSMEGSLFPVDEQGMVMEHALYPTKEDLPIVNIEVSNRQLHVGKKVDDKFLKKVIALQKRILKERPEFLPSISEYYSENGKIMIIDSRYGSRILLGMQDLRDQLRRYQFVQENGDVNRRDIFDLRFKNQVVVRQEVQ